MLVYQYCGHYYIINIKHPMNVIWLVVEHFL